MVFYTPDGGGFIMPRTGGSPGYYLVKDEFDTLVWIEPTDSNNAQTVRAWMSSALPTCTYNNGTDGVGATLTKSSNGALPAIDGVTLINGDFIGVNSQASFFQNGIYEVTDNSCNCVLWYLDICFGSLLFISACKDANNFG